ncbi:anhydro-N-acetylmuramic acid kinase [Halioglobus japonicus]|uniref:Anhydro-N-acetylmuramic acid kinase n=1 Tax=Halioglobus japonicus TaxID=930805 RepID=A0AAP8MBS4_9GAMM|nr:anhydro-N-acetylmuramic acid kinase [Halioglobus japonicus]AQA16993.1 anhydro-N-acetylmuramic acid kinase [Halioglobus japonicus]PLW84896.1 anhydro-N-acetylmuramic acid kinase [Halioglobus japonicus]GHD18383.1 anhydro-N-acetylmuramic acid kinase [Halioglobus japonicus]
MAEGLYLGLMSGTSMDAIDAAIVACSEQGTRLIHTHEEAIPAGLREQIHTLSHSGNDEIEQLGRLDRALGQLFARAATQLLTDANIAAGDIRAIGSHGQTLRHRPPSAGHGEYAFTLQAGDPNTIAELTGITTVADFRRRDMAAGGEGAPLAPAFHALAFGAAETQRAIVNIGGIANVSLLDGTRLEAGFDTGPGNTLMDHWHQRHRDGHFDRDGAWAAQGQAQETLLEGLLAHEYFQLKGARSTGKEAFNLAWLDSQLEGHSGTTPVDVQASLCEFTARTIAVAITGEQPATTEVYLCGGGAHNAELRRRLAEHLPNARVTDTSALGIDPDWVEAALFGWLAYRTLNHQSGNAAQVTGAQGERILGGIYPAG